MKKPISWLETFQFEGSRGRPMPKRVVLHQTNRLLEKYYRRDYRSALGSMEPYAGSQWWALSRDAVSYVLKFGHDNPQLVRFFKHSLIPDETFIQKIVANSDFRRRIGRNFTYTDFSGGHSGPALVSEYHLQLFVDKSFQLNNPAGAGPCFFARKFGPMNDRLLDTIDEIRAAI